MFLLASSARAVDAVRFVNVVVPLILAVVTLAVVTDTFVSVTLPLLTVTFANVMLLSVVTVFPSWIAVLPNVMVVAKLASRLDNGIDAVAEPKV
jgi:intracellular septation protein A